MIVFLSYPIELTLPVYGDTNQEIGYKRVKSLENGDSCNTSWFAMENHWGTHVDCPAHFFKQGMSIADYPAGYWRFATPQVISINLKPDELLGIDQLTGRINPETDLLLLKSGWSVYRGKDPCYCMNNPGVDPEVGCWLRKDYTNIRAIGIDWISVSPFGIREIGRLSHKAFLNPEGEGKPILLIEDMYIPPEVGLLKEVWVSPLRIKTLDSAPCTVIGVRNND